MQNIVIQEDFDKLSIEELINIYSNININEIRLEVGILSKLAKCKSKTICKFIDIFNNVNAYEFNTPKHTKYTLYGNMFITFNNYPLMDNKRKHKIINHLIVRGMQITENNPTYDSYYEYIQHMTKYIPIYNKIKELIFCDVLKFNVNLINNIDNNINVIKTLLCIVKRKPFILPKNIIIKKILFFVLTI